jgi:hypothetical protein
MPWETSNVIAGDLDVGSPCDVPEVRRLRAHSSWFATLNAYRNSFFHHGWRHGSGNYGEGEEHSAARSPAANGLLLPDQESLKSRSKPHEWTWNNGQTVDAIARMVHEGLDAVVGELCEKEWGTPVPERGTFPEDKYPNCLVTVVPPAVLVTESDVIVPFFSTEGLARAFVPFCGSDELELVQVRASNVVAGGSAITFSLHGLEASELPPTVTMIRMYLDPNPRDLDWSEVDSRSRASLALEALVRQGFHKSLSIPLTGLEKVFVWRPRKRLEWH